MCTVWFCLLLKPVFLARLFICKDCKNPLNLIWESESLLQKRRAPPGVIIARSGNGRWFGTMAAFGESVCSQSLSRASWFLICIVPICCVDVLCSYSLPFPPPPQYHMSSSSSFLTVGIWPLQLSPPLILESFLMPSGALDSNGWRIIWLTLLIFQIRPHRNLAIWWNACPALNTCVCAGGVMVTWPWSWFLRGRSLGRWGRPWLTTLFSKKKVLCMEDCWKACSFLQILYSSFFERSRP